MIFGNIYFLSCFLKEKLGILMVSKGRKNKNSWLFSKTLTGLVGHRDDSDSSFNYHQNSKKFFIKSL